MIEQRLRPRIPWHAYVVLLRPRRVSMRLEELVEAGVLDRAPSLWQVELGVMRMWLRVLFRFDSIGCSGEQRVRQTWRARLLANRLLRGPFLLWERAIAPLDHSGLASPRWRVIRHLLAAHHDRHQFAYDLQMLGGTPGALEEVRAKALAVVEEDTRRSRWLEDLVVFEGYHQSLVEAVDRALRGAPLVDEDEADDPDIGFDAYIRWCLAQPATPVSTWRAWRRGDFPRVLLPSKGNQTGNIRAAA